MYESTGFVDLRVAHGAGGIGDDSVWPSFTDVMTVIVMIFLMALVVIMLRNFELNRELVSSASDNEATLLINQNLAKEKTEIEGILNQTLTEKGVLESTLELERQNIASLSADQAALESELQTLLTTRQQLEITNKKLAADKQVSLDEVGRLVAVEHMLNSKITDLSDRLAALRLGSSQQITSLSKEKQSLGGKLDTVSKQLAEIRNLLAQTSLENQALSAEISGLTELNEETAERFSIANEEIQVLTKLINQRELEISELQAQSASSGQQFRSLQEEYDSLDQAYRKLIRPARNTAGKYVVEVWIEKPESQLQYKIREPGQIVATVVSRPQLDPLLRDLKAKHGNLLYIKIVIPEDSNLSHNEAWRFTQEMLKKYDYYSQ